MFPARNSATALRLAAASAVADELLAQVQEQERIIERLRADRVVAIQAPRKIYSGFDFGTGGIAREALEKMGALPGGVD